MAVALDLTACEEDLRPQAPVPGLLDDPGAPPAADADTTVPSTESADQLFTPQRVRRLSLHEYVAAVVGLFGEQARGWVAPVVDPRVHGFDNNAEALSVSSGNFEEFAVSAEVIAQSADVGALAGCGADDPPARCAARFIRELATRAYGREPSADELARLDALYRDAAAAHDHVAALRLLVQAVLLSPHFLYRPELGEPLRSAGPYGLTPLELANALSFAATGLRADAALLARATTDPSFSTRDALASEARRLLATPQGHRHLVRFVRAWLGVLDLKTMVKIPAMFPEYTLALRDELEQEMQRFVEFALEERHGTVEHLFTLPVTFAGPSLAHSVYRLDYEAAGATLPASSPSGELMLRPELRRGVVSLASWLAAHSPVHRSSPVDRGIAIRTRLFCQTLPPPPPGAFATAPSADDATATTRTKFERHSTDRQCSGCHKLVDPIGFGFEMMDTLGRYREREHALPVDSSGMLVGTDVDGPFRGPAELALRLAKSAELRDCLVVQLFRFVEGREPVDSDRARVHRLQRAFRSGDGRLSELLVNMVTDPDFALRSSEP